MYKHLLLDLDNTLYPASAAMNDGITFRMISFVSKWLGVSYEEAIAARKNALPSYGTTLEWLIAEKKFTDVNAYFEAVHPESELEELKPDLYLRGFLKSLGIPLTLLTNAPLSHAERVLRFFNIEDLFIGIFDITYHNGKGKPHSDSFIKTLEKVKYTVDQTLFVDDHPKYVAGYKNIGGQAILVDEKGIYAELAQKEGYGRIKNIYEIKKYL